MALVLNHLHRIKIQPDEGIILTQGRDGNNREFYAYIRINEAGLQKARDYQRAGQRLNLMHLGDVLMMGFGLEPSAEVKQHMETIFNFCHAA